MVIISSNGVEQEVPWFGVVHNKQPSPTVAKHFVGDAGPCFCVQQVWVGAVEPDNGQAQGKPGR